MLFLLKNYKQLKWPLAGALLLPGQLRFFWRRIGTVGGLMVEIGSYRRFIGPPSIGTSNAWLRRHFQKKSNWLSKRIEVNWLGASYKDLFDHNIKRYGVEHSVWPVADQSNNVSRRGIMISIYFYWWWSQIHSVRNDLLDLSFFEQGWTTSMHDVFRGQVILERCFRLIAFYLKLNFKVFVRGQTV